MTDRLPPVALAPGEGERLPRGDLFHRVLLEIPALEVIEMRFAADFEGVDLHTHADHADCFYVLEGEAEFSIDGVTHRFGPGGFVASPIGTVHGFRNVGGTELRMLNLHAPNAGFVERLRQP
jgi:mannose-6-phosphate isomerase-like protein (cupin superfamily)